MYDIWSYGWYLDIMPWFDMNDVWSYGWYLNIMPWFDMYDIWIPWLDLIRMISYHMDDIWISWFDLIFIATGSALWAERYKPINNIWSCGWNPSYIYPSIDIFHIMELRYLIVISTLGQVSSHILLNVCFIAAYNDLMLKSQLVVSFESQSWLKVKVVKWCRKKWNEYMMYKYIKYQNYANAIAFFSNWIFLRYPGHTMWKLTYWAFRKCHAFSFSNWPIIFGGKWTIDAWNKFYTWSHPKIFIFASVISVSFAQNKPKSDISGALEPIHYITLKAFAMALRDGTKCKTCFGCPRMILQYFSKIEVWLFTTLRYPFGKRPHFFRVFFPAPFPNWQICKKKNVSAQRNNVEGRRSDNYEATGRAHSSFWRFLPKLFREHIEIGITSKIWGPR